MSWPRRFRRSIAGAAHRAGRPEWEAPGARRLVLPGADRGPGAQRQPGPRGRSRSVSASFSSSGLPRAEGRWSTCSGGARSSPPDKPRPSWCRPRRTTPGCRAHHSAAQGRWGRLGLASSAAAPGPAARCPDAAEPRRRAGRGCGLRLPGSAGRSSKSSGGPQRGPNRPSLGAALAAARLDEAAGWS